MILFLVAVSGVVYFQTDLLRLVEKEPGLSGLVSVRGGVSLEQLKLTAGEIGIINSAVDRYRGTFTKVQLVVDSVGRIDHIEPGTVLVMAVELQTSGDLLIKSWSRKLPRSKLVGQLTAYMAKAADEYNEFKRFPDVKQNFKTLYI
ncbi:hypothetical protein [Pseudodesulfovibrio indicus]|uniref:hypothetical protein n=1 Tax=Pseudodesulfovibrio indicus TaxID=1716143 RepID=UPI00292E1E16|nr:hypothetical protein [Pseudodesulfovibrio indicus]